MDGGGRCLCYSRLKHSDVGASECTEGCTALGAFFHSCSLHVDLSCTRLLQPAFRPSHHSLSIVAWTSLSSVQDPPPWTFGREPVRLRRLQPVFASLLDRASFRAFFNGGVSFAMPCLRPVGPFGLGPSIGLFFGGPKVCWRLGLPRLLGSQTSRAPNSRIGGSGSTAGFCAPCMRVCLHHGWQVDWPQCFRVSTSGAFCGLVPWCRKFCASAGQPVVGLPRRDSNFLAACDTRGVRNSCIGRSGATTSGVAAPGSVEIVIDWKPCSVGCGLGFCVLACALAAFVGAAATGLCWWILQVGLPAGWLPTGPEGCHCVAGCRVDSTVVVHGLLGACAVLGTGHLLRGRPDSCWVQWQACSCLLSLQIALTCSLLGLLWGRPDFRRSPGGGLLLGCVAWVPVALALPLGDIVHVGATCRVTRRAGRPGTDSASPCCRDSCVARVCRLLLFMLALPEAVVVQPWGFATTTFCLAASLPTGGYAMTRAPDSGMSAPVRARRPHELLPSELITYAGTHSVQLPWAEAGGIASGHPEVRVCPWTGPPLTASGADATTQLGVYVHTPYYHAVAAAVNVGVDSRTLPSVIDLIRHQVPGVPEGLFDYVVPLRPQRFAGYASFVRVPGAVRPHGNFGGVAVVLDLTRAGGRYFATVVPARLDYDALLAFITPLTHHGEAPLCLYVGAFVRPWPVEMPVDLHDGDVITVTHGPSNHVSQLRIEALFEDGADWGCPRDMPRPEHTDGVCALYQKSRFFIPPHHHYGETFVEAIARCVNRPPQELTCCSFPVADLEVHGDHASCVITVVDAPHPQQAHAVHAARRDVFVLCDLRPLGLKPRFIRTHCLVVHRPSLLSAFDLQLHPAFRVEVVGGRSQGDDIYLTGNETLLFYARKAREGEIAAPVGSVGSSSSEDSSDSSRIIQAELQDVDPPPWDWTADSAEVRLDNPDSDSAPTGPHEPPALRCGPRTPDYEDLCLVSASPAAASPAGSSHASDSGPIPCVTPPGADAGTGGSSRYAGRTSAAEARPFLATGPAGAEPLAFAGTHHGNALSADSGGADTTRVLVLVYVPQYVPEMLLVTLSLPCGVEHALAAVQARRSAGTAQHFPRLYVAQPHPVRDFVLLAAGPEWDAPGAVVIFDCRQISHTFFSAWVHASLNRESILLAAGFRADAEHQVFVHGLLQPLAVGQIITLFSGMVIVCAPVGTHAPATFDLPTMLQSRSDWKPQADVPGAGHAPGTYFHILTDAGSQRFVVGSWRRQHFRSDLARQLRACDAALTVKPTTPRITDHFDQGFLSSGVLVATERLSRLPVPPARVKEHRLLLVLDCRRILQGFRWLLLETATVPLRELSRRFLDCCPAGYRVAFWGAAVENVPEGPRLRVAHGQVVTADFVEDACLDDSPAPGSDGNGPPADPDVGRLGPSADRSCPARARSRSPRQGGGSPPGRGATGATGAGADASFAALQLEPVGTSGSAESFLERAIDHDFQDAGGPAEAVTRLTRVVFGILMPDFAVESVAVDLSLPATVADAIAAIEVTRGAELAHAFPVLVPVTVQPDARWGLFLATPAWAAGGIFICIDVYAWQQRIFAMPAPPSVTGAFLLEAVGLALSAPVNIFVDGRGPLRLHEEVAVLTGSCVQVQACGVQGREVWSLADLLRCDPPWANTEAFPDDDSRQRCGLVTDNGVQVVDLSPSCQRSFREQVEQALSCPMEALALSPGVPRPRDVSVQGAVCHAVAAAAAPAGLPHGRCVVLGLLDARRVLRGWSPIIASEGWLNTYSLLEALYQGVPAPWRVALHGIPVGQQWVLIEPGRILTAFCFAAEPSPLSCAPPILTGGGPAPPSDSEDDDENWDHWRHIAAVRAPAAGRAQGASGRRASSAAAHSRAWRPSVVECCPVVHAARHPTNLMCKWTWISFFLAAYRPGRSALTSVFQVGPSRRTAAAALAWFSLCYSCSAWVCARVHCAWRPAGPSLVPVVWLLCAAWTLGNSWPALPASDGGVAACLLALGLLFRSPRDLGRRPASCFGVGVGVVVAQLCARPADAVQLPSADKLPLASMAHRSQGLDARPVPPSQLLAIPTPCRNWRRPGLHAGPDGSTCRWHTDHKLRPSDRGLGLHTLLEEANEMAGGYAFYLAATLLDTLVDHTQSPRRAVSSAHCGDCIRPPRVLDLMTLVPPTPFQRLAVELETLLPIPFLATAGGLAAGQDWLDSDLRCLTLDPRVPASWRDRFAAIPVWRDHAQGRRLTGLDIYTDGSADGAVTDQLLAPCAWAFSVWALAGEQQFLVGWAAHAAVPEDTPYWVGEEHDDALEGEALAIVWALVWILEWGHQFRVPMVLRYDAVSVGAGIFGEQQPPHRQGATSPTRLVQLAIALRQRAQVWYKLGHAHVPGHAGVVGNELCDQLSKWARRQRDAPYERLLPTWPSALSRHALLPWTWMAHLRSSQLPALAAVEAEARRLQCLPAVAPQAPQMGVQALRSRAAEVAVDLVVATYNVLTLFDPGTALGRKARAGAYGMQIAGKRSLLKKQMLEGGVWALGLQETRLPDSAILPDPDLLMLNAAADDGGSYGSICGSLSSRWAASHGG